MKCFEISNSKNIVATLRIATMKKPELTFVLILSLYANKRHGEFHTVGGFIPKFFEIDTRR